LSLVLSLIAAAFYSVSSAMLSRTLKGRRAVSDSKVVPVIPRLENTGFASADQRCTPLEADAAAHKAHRQTLIFATIAVVLHGWLVINQTGLPHDLYLPLFASISATTLTIVLLHIALCMRKPADYLGLAIYPIAAISLIVSQASGGGPPIDGTAIQIHVLLSLVSYGLLSLAAAQAVLVAIQRHFLATHRPGGFIRVLPPMDTTESLLFTLLSTGFAVLSLALLSGFLYLEDMFDQRLVHKTVLSCLGWAIFGVLLFGRWQFGWRGKKAVHWTLAGFAVMILAYFGTRVIIEIVLSG